MIPSSHCLPLNSPLMIFVLLSSNQERKDRWYATTPFGGAPKDCSFWIFLDFVNLQFKNTKNLFIHIAHYPVRRFLRDIPTFLKCPLHSLVGEGVCNDRYQGDSAHETQPTPSLFIFSLTRVEVLLDCSRFQLLLLLILLISLNFILPFSPQKWS